MKDKKRKLQTESDKAVVAVAGGKQTKANDNKGKKARKIPENISKKSDRFDIDDIFATGMKEATKKKEKLKVEKELQELLVKKRREMNKEEKKKTQTFRNQDPKPVRYDAKQGMNVYSMESLGIGKGGYTKDCPFDCYCCY